MIAMMTKSADFVKVTMSRYSTDDLLAGGGGEGGEDLLNRRGEGHVVTEGLADALQHAGEKTLLGLLEGLGFVGLDSVPLVQVHDVGHVEGLGVLDEHGLVGGGLDLGSHLLLLELLPLLLLLQVLADVNAHGHLAVSVLASARWLGHIATHVSTHVSSHVHVATIATHVSTHVSSHVHVATLLHLLHGVLHHVHEVGVEAGGCQRDHGRREDELEYHDVRTVLAPLTKWSH